MNMYYIKFSNNKKQTNKNPRIIYTINIQRINNNSFFFNILFKYCICIFKNK